MLIIFVCLSGKKGERKRGRKSIQKTPVIYIFDMGGCLEIFCHVLYNFLCYLIWYKYGYDMNYAWIYWKIAGCNDMKKDSYSNFCEKKNVFDSLEFQGFYCMKFSFKRFCGNLSILEFSLTKNYQEWARRYPSIHHIYLDLNL